MGSMFIKRLKSKGLAFQLIISILSATVLIISGVLIYNYHFSKKLLLESARETAKQLTNATLNRMESVLISAQRVPEALMLFLNEPSVKEETIEDMLRFVLKNKPEIFGTAIAFAPFKFKPGLEGYAPYCYRTADGFGIKNLDHESYSYFDWTWYKTAEETGRPVWTEPYFDEGGGNTVMSTYAVPFYGDEGTGKVFRGVATADLSLDWLETMMNSIKVFETGYVIMVSEQGTIITHPVKQFQMRNLSELAMDDNNSALMKITSEMMQDKEGYMPFTSLIDHRSCWMYFTTLPQTRWHMAVVFPENELLAGLHKLYFYTIFIGVFGAILLSIVVILFSSQITKPLRRLTMTANKIGSGNFNVEIGEDNSTREIYLLGNALSRMQSELKDYIRNLEVTTAAKERFESELNIAHEIQQGMIPKIFPPFPGRDDIDIFALLEPARQVGGDLYDFFFLDDDTLCFAIGDVSDKGVPASLMMAITITLFRSEADKTKSVIDIVRNINHDVCQGNENLMFITFFMGILDMRTGELVFCNAGHNYPYLLKNDGVLKVLDETHGVPLGIDEDQQYQTGKIILEKNDTLVLYSDGITEAMNSKGELFGDERFEKLIQTGCQGLSTRQIAGTVMEDVGGFADTPERSDDITLLVLQYYPSKKQDSDEG
jgi:phosphoserine phosphatase RsbU/P